MSSLFRRAVGTLAVAALAASAVACGASTEVKPTAATASPTPTATQAAATATPRPKPSGEITVYTAGPAGLATGLTEAFTTATGVKVNVFQGDTGAVLAKLDAEKANPHADVVILADWSGAFGLAQQGLLASYLPEKGDQVPAVYRDPENRFIAQGLTGLGLTYNTKVVSKAPTTVAELTGPEWKNKVTMPDPAASGSVYGIVAATTQKMGDEKAWAMFADLKKNGVVVLGTNAKALEPVLTGSKSAVLGAADYIALGSIQKGEALKVVYPADGTVVAPRPMMIMKSTKNLVAAQAFADFVMSDAGQAQVAKTLIIPGRADVPVDPARQPLSALNPLPVDWSKAIAAQPESLKKFADTVTR
jgi:iron(III) transport system substrate-binding protein